MGSDAPSQRMAFMARKNSRSDGVSARWPCVVGSHRREAVEIMAGYLPPGRFGPFIRAWRIYHCQTVNPYGSDGCPYPASSCLAAFREAIEAASQAAKPIPYFVRYAHQSGLNRAEDRGRHARNQPNPSPGPGTGSGLRRTGSGLQSIGALFWGTDARPREVSADDGKEGT